MSYGLIYTIPFMTLENEPCVINIEKKDYTGESTELQAGETPFTIDIEDEDFLYTPTRFSTAKIDIVGCDYLQGIYSTSYQEYRVTYLKNGKVQWCGFVKPEAYTQDYVTSKFTLEIECLSALSTLEYIDYAKKEASLQFVSLWYLFLKCISSANGNYTSIYIPYVYSDSADNYKAGSVNVLENLTISEQNFFDEDGKAMKPSNLSRLLKGENLTPSIAAKLERALDIPANLWLSLQTQYDKDVKAINIRDEQERASFNTERMLSTILNLPELYKRLNINTSFFIQKKLQILQDLLGFQPLDIREKRFAQQICYKKSDKLNIDEKNQATWLTLAYINARGICLKSSYSKGNALTAAKEISQKVHIENLSEKKIQQILNNNGIVYAVVEKLEKAPIDAVSIKVENHPAIVTTHRHNDMSRLVFNILHERSYRFARILQPYPISHNRLYRFIDGFILSHNDRLKLFFQVRQPQSFTLCYALNRYTRHR